MRELLTEWLVAEGHDVHVTTPASADPVPTADLVIVDLYMPRHAGATRLRNVKQAYPGVPVIAISAQFRPGLAGSCTAAELLGVHQVMAKPFTRHELLAAIDSAIPSLA